MIVFSQLLIAWGSILINSTFTAIILITMMAIVAIYYSFVKRAGLLFCMLRKLKQSATEKLNRDAQLQKGQNPLLEIKFSSLSFEESSTFSRRDYIIIILLSLIIAVPFLYFVFVLFYFLKSGKLLEDMSVLYPGLYSVIDFVFQLCLSSFMYITLFLPVVLILHVLLNYGVKKTMKRLKKNCLGRNETHDFTSYNRGKKWPFF